MLTIDLQVGNCALARILEADVDGAVHLSNPIHDAQRHSKHRLTRTKLEDAVVIALNFVLVNVFLRVGSLNLQIL